MRMMSRYLNRFAVFAISLLSIAITLQRRCCLMQSGSAPFACSDRKCAARMIQ